MLGVEVGEGRELAAQKGGQNLTDSGSCPLPGWVQVWSLTQFYSVDFSQSKIGVKKCVFYKRTIKVCVSCC